MHKIIISALLGYCLSANALVFTEDTTTGEINASGEIEVDDGEKLRKILTLEFRQNHNNVRGLVSLNINSSGGSVIGGFLLGYTIRDLHVHTNVPINQACYSACALAFLGGTYRTVEGKYGVHAASFSKSANTNQAASQLDSIQYVGALITAYAHEMTGKPDLAVRALSTSAQQMSVLSDSELGAFGVITLARRPGQYGKTGFKCPSEISTTVLSAICTHIDISELDLELNKLYSQITKEAPPANLKNDQAAWLKYRNSCINDSAPNGFSSVVECIKISYRIRRDQLQSIWLDISTRKTDQVSSKWRPIESR